jgi:tetratricopeptide (TPR) repeat protein
VLQQKRGVRFQMRQGLNTGLVVVGSIGSDLRMDYTAGGDTTNVAARLQQTADPGRIVIAEATHRLIEGYFHTRSLGALTLKGKAEAVEAWEVISARAARTRLDVEAERGLTQFVSRERELRILMDSFEQAKAGEGQVVFITGEPGIGKSRLLHEFHRRIGAQATWVEGRSMSFGQSIAFHPLIDLMKRSFRIEEGDNEGTIIKKIQHSVLLLGEDLRATLPYLRAFLSVDPGDPAVVAMEPRQRRAAIFEAARRLHLRAAEVHPQVIVFEDLHWMDKATEEYLLFVADSIPTSRSLLLFTYRPGYTHPFGERTYHTRIALNTLSQKDSVAMAKAVLAAGSLPEDLITLIFHKAEGNPFYVEEMVKSLQELGLIRQSPDGSYALAKRLDEIVIPDTIQGVIMSRIDRLDDAPKKTLQLASVIGREFTRRLLDRIGEIGGRNDEFVRELKAIELIYEKSGSLELAYMFKHALTHDVAYNSLLIQRRKELHRAIGLAIEELYAGRLSEHYEVLAHHFSKAEDWAKALEYLTKAAEKAARAFANLEAVALYDQALVALSHLEESRETLEKAIDLRLGLRNALHPLGEFDRYVDRLHEARDLAEALGDRRRLGWALAYLCHGYTVMGDYDRAIASGQGAFVEPVGELAIRIVAGVYLGAAYHWSGDYPRAIDCYRRALASLEGQPVQERFGLVAMASVLIRAYLAMSLAEVGKFAEGRTDAEEAVRLAEAESHPYSEIWAKNFLGYLYLRSGDPAIEILERALALCEDTGTRIGYPIAASYLGSAYARVGRLDEAIPLQEQAVDAAGPMRFVHGQALRVSLLSEAYLCAGRTPDALEAAERALALSREHKERGHEAWTLKLLGDIHGELRSTQV